MRPDAKDFYPLNKDKDFETINNEFPFEYEFECWDGSQRTFTISCQQFPEYGFLVSAMEKDKDGNGYEFAAASPFSPYLALSDLRAKIKKALSKRHIAERENGYTILHDTVEGRISGNGENLIFIVDGMVLNTRDLLSMFGEHDGWQFKLCFVDKAEEIPV